MTPEQRQTRINIWGEYVATPFQGNDVDDETLLRVGDGAWTFLDKQRTPEQIERDAAMVKYNSNGVMVIKELE